jgi:hypothetical protein
VAILITLLGRQNNLAVSLIGCTGSLTVLLEELSIAPPHHLNFQKIVKEFVYFTCLKYLCPKRI